MMNFEGEMITWEEVVNTVAERMVDSSLVHRLVAKRKLKRRTRILNSMIQKMSVHSYSQYIKMKTAVLRNFPHDSDSDDNASFTDEDYQRIYQSDEAMKKYRMDTSRRSMDLSCMEGVDDDYIILSQPGTSGTQDSLGWQRVIKKKHTLTNGRSNTGKIPTTVLQRTTSQIRKGPEQKSSVNRRKKLVNKVADKKSVSIQNSIKELFIAKQLSNDNDNDALRSEKNAENIPGTNLRTQCDLVDDVPLSERGNRVPTGDKQTIRITNTDNSENKTSQDNIVNEVLPNDTMKQGSLTEGQPDECTPKKHANTTKKASCKPVQEELEDSDDDFIPPTQSITTGIRDSLSWKKLAKKNNKLTKAQSKSGRCQTTELQKATSHTRKESDGNSLIEKKKKLSTKIHQLVNDSDVLSHDNNAEDVSDISLRFQFDEKDDIDDSSICRFELRTISDKKTAQIPKTGGPQNKSSEDNILKEVQLNDTMQQESSIESQLAECNTKKHSDTIKKKSCVQQKDLEDSDNDYIPPTQPNTSGIQGSPSKQKVTKKNSKLTKPGKCHTTELQTTTSNTGKEPDENIATEKKKKLAKKTGDKMSVSIENSAKVISTDQQLSNGNDALSNENNADDGSHKSSDTRHHFQGDAKKDTVLNETEINESTINPSELQSTDDKQTVQITKTDGSKNKSAQDNIVNEVLPSNTIKQGGLTERQLNECTTKKQTDATKKKSCELQEELEDSDNDYIPPTQPVTSRIQDSPGKQKLAKKSSKLTKSGKSHITELQTATSNTRKEPNESFATEKKKLTKKIGEKASVSIQNSTKVISIEQQLSKDNDGLSNENNADDVSHKSRDIRLRLKGEAKDDAPLSERVINDSSIDPSELRSADNKQTVEITNTASSQNNSSQDNIVKEVLPNDDTKQKSSTKKKPDECTTEKHSNTGRKQSSKHEEKSSSVKKEIHNSTVKETDENNKKTIIGHVSKASTNDATENVKKNLMGVFNNFSVISGNKAPEIHESNANESIDMSRSQLRISDMDPLCRSTPMPFVKTASKIPKSVSENQPKDSGIDEDSQEESSENGKVKDEMHKRILIDAIQDTRIVESSQSHDDSDSTDQPTMVIDEDRSGKETDDENKLESTLVSNSQVVKDEEPHRQKPQLTITCTEIVNQKYKIITTKRLDEVKESDKEKKSDHHQEDSIDDSKTEVAVTDEQEDHQTQGLLTEEQARIDHEEDSEDPDEIMSATSTKRVQQLKRLNLIGDSSSSEDENHTVCKSQVVSKSTVKKDETDDDSDNEDSTFISKSKNLKSKCESEKTATKKQKCPKVLVPCALKSTEKKVKDVKENQRVLNTTQNDESFSFSESGSETDTSRKTKSISTYKSEKPMLKTSILPKKKNLAKKDIKKHAQKAIATKSTVLVGNGQTQTEVHIPPTLILKRPNNLQEYTKQEGELEVVVDRHLTSFSSRDLSNNELFIMDIPKKLLNSELLGQKITLTMKKLKLGKEKYKAMHKDVESVTCVLNSGDVHKPFESVQLKPAAVVVTQARIGEKASTIKLPKAVHSEATKNLPSTSGSVSKSVKKRSNSKSLQQKSPKVQVVKGIRKRKLSDSKSLEVFHKKEKKRKREIVQVNES